MRSNQTYKTKPTKPNLQDQTYQIKPAKQNLANQTYWALRIQATKKYSAAIY